MPEHSDSLRRRLGITRRDLLRRGIIVGGALIWTVPVLESLKPNAFAHNGSPNPFFCCFCKAKPHHENQTKCIRPAPHTAAECKTACTNLGFKKSQFFHGPNRFECGKNGCKVEREHAH